MQEQQIPQSPLTKFWVMANVCKNPWGIKPMQDVEVEDFYVNALDEENARAKVKELCHNYNWYFLGAMETIPC
jgi:hypothetical protein